MSPSLGTFYVTMPSVMCKNVLDFMPRVCKSIREKLQTSNEDAPSGKESRLKWDRHRRVSAALKPRHLLLTQFDRGEGETETERESTNGPWWKNAFYSLSPRPTDGQRTPIVLILSLHPHDFRPKGQLAEGLEQNLQQPLNLLL